MHTSPLPWNNSKSLLLIPPAYKSISLQILPRVLISEKIYSIKINKYLSAHTFMKAALDKSLTTPLSTQEEEPGMQTVKSMATR